MRRGIVLSAVFLSVASPALLPDPGDGFPVSSYPMFSHDRDRVVAVATAVGIDGAGAEHRLGPYVVGGGDEVMLAASAARHAAAGGPGAAARYCDEVAGRVRDPAVVAVEVRTEVRDAVADVRARHDPLDVVVHARCEVRG